MQQGNVDLSRTGLVSPSIPGFLIDYNRNKDQGLFHYILYEGNVPWNKKGPCVHHWMIDKNNVGTCKKCGEVKDFGVLLMGKSERLRERQIKIA